MICSRKLRRIAEYVFLFFTDKWYFALMLLFPAYLTAVDTGFSLEISKSWTEFSEETWIDIYIVCAATSLQSVYFTFCIPKRYWYITMGCWISVLLPIFKTLKMPQEVIMMAWCVTVGIHFMPSLGLITGESFPGAWRILSVIVLFISFYFVNEHLIQDKDPDLPHNFIIGTLLQVSIYYAIGFKCIFWYFVPTMHGIIQLFGHFDLIFCNNHSWFDKDQWVYIATFIIVHGYVTWNLPSAVQITRDIHPMSNMDLESESSAAVQTMVEPTEESSSVIVLDPREDIHTSTLSRPREDTPGLMSSYGREDSFSFTHFHQSDYASDGSTTREQIEHSISLSMTNLNLNPTDDTHVANSFEAYSSPMHSSGFSKPSTVHKASNVDSFDPRNPIRPATFVRDPNTYEHDYSQSAYIMDMEPSSSSLSYMRDVDKEMTLKFLLKGSTIEKEVRADLLGEGTWDPNATDGDGLTPLMRACFANCSADVIQRIIELNADVSKKSHISGCTALHFASRYCEPEVFAAVVDSLIQSSKVAGSLIHHENKKGETPIFYAVRGDSVYALEKLIELGADVNHQSHVSTQLHPSNTFDDDLYNKGKKTPLDVAELCNSENSMRILEQHGAMNVSDMWISEIQLFRSESPTSSRHSRENSSTSSEIDQSSRQSTENSTSSKIVQLEYSTSSRQSLENSTSSFEVYPKVCSSKPI